MKNQIQAVFSDIDGTLLDSDHKLRPLEKEAIDQLAANGVHFVLVSARSPLAVRPMMRQYGLRCVVAGCCGALICDQDGKSIYSDGLTAALAKEIVEFVEQFLPSCAWNVYFGDEWLVKDDSDRRVRLEEEIVGAKSTRGSVGDLPQNTVVAKLLLMCDESEIDRVQQVVGERFHQVAVAKSSPTLLEVTKKGLNKGEAVKRACKLLGVDAKNAVAFGDGFTDIPMLEEVGSPFLMANAPKEICGTFPSAESCDDDGIYKTLCRLGVI